MHLSGSEAEDRACEVLRKLGFEIVARNWRCRYGELDVVAREDDVLAFVEVKARASRAFGGPEGAVTAGKQRRIVAAASLFLAERNCRLPVRFDVMTFVESEATLFRDAFRGDLSA
jgi:putative endonuclease